MKEARTIRFSFFICYGVSYSYFSNFFNENFLNNNYNHRFYCSEGKTLDENSKLNIF